MASTIQLRTGTGSAVPSALTQGEVAINVTNGLVYYGSGSGNDVKQLESFTHITASGDISASGTIIAATLDAAAVSDTLAAAVVAEIDNDEIPIAKLAEDAVTVTAGTNLSNGGTVTLGGSITLNVDDAFLKNDADDTTSGTITSAGLIATKDTDGGDTIIQVINSNTDGGTDKGAGIEFLHGSALGALSGNQKAGKILSTKASSYQGTTAAVDSNLEFYTANNDTDTLQLKIDNLGLAAFTGDVSASNFQTTTGGKLFNGANSTQYVEFDSTTEIQISSSAVHMIGHVTASGNISASGRIYGRQFEQIETNFAEDFSSRGVVYMPFSNQSISDNTNSSNINVNRVAAVPGKPVKSVIRAVADTLGNNAQYTMSYWEAAAGDPTTPILKSAAYAITDASSNKDAIIFDFTDPGSGSTTDVAVGSRIWMTLEAEGTGNGSFIVTHVWEWDYNSIM